MFAMDILLKRYGKTRYNVAQHSALSEQMLSAVNRRDLSTYSVKVIDAIAATLEQSPAEVLTALAEIETSGTLYPVETPAELKMMVKLKAPTFLVVGDFSNVIKKIKADQLTETERLGFDLGSGGWGGLQTFIWDFIFDTFSKRELTEIDNRLKTTVQTLYTIKIVDEQTAQLTLQQDEY